MATRAIRNLDRLFIYQFHIIANITAFTTVKFGPDDDHVVACDSNDPLAIGWTHYAVTLIDATRTDLPVDVIMNGLGVIPVSVAAGQIATRGSPAVGVTGAATYKNSPTVGGGATLTPFVGRFMQSGVAGDILGLLVLSTNSYQLTA